jgi:hypothetical protein
MTPIAHIWINALAVFVGLVIANFAYQATCRYRNWGLAREISFFQAIALALLAWQLSRSL